MENNIEIKLDVAFQEAMLEINDLNRKLILERSIRKQMEMENRELKMRIEEMEKSMKEK